MVTNRSTEQINEAIDQIMVKQLTEAKPAGRLDLLEESMNNLADATVVGKIEALEKQSVVSKTDLEDMRKPLTEHVEPTIDAVKQIQMETKALTDELTKIKKGLQHMGSSTVNVTTMTAHIGRLEETTQKKLDTMAEQLRAQLSADAATGSSSSSAPTGHSKRTIGSKQTLR